MNNELLFEESEVNNLDDDLSVELDGLISDDTPGLKPGVKLPKNECQWREADMYFRSELPICGLDIFVFFELHSISNIQQLLFIWLLMHTKCLLSIPIFNISSLIDLFNLALRLHNPY
jgi:hypothetical protein